MSELPTGNQELYDRIDVVSLRLNELGMNKEARLLTFMIHKVAWTSAGELFRELGASLRKIVASPQASQFPEDFKVELRTYIEMLADAADEYLPE